MRYRLSALARQDLDDTWAYVALNASVETADLVIDRILRAFARIARYPQSGRRREDIAPDVRSVPVDSYVVYYKLLDGMVVIARVLHGSRDLPELEDGE